MRRKLVSRASNSVREVVGQKVDDVAAVVQPLVYVTGISQNHQLGRKCSQNAPRFCWFINAESPWFTASQDQISSIIGSSSLLFDSICRRTGSQHYGKIMSSKIHET
jgi:hypothetical protein